MARPHYLKFKSLSLQLFHELISQGVAQIDVPKLLQPSMLPMVT
jgi:hypothetical protein